MQIFLLLLGSYLLGSTMSALIVSNLLKLPDPRQYGSKNPGTTNMARGNNQCATALTFIGDICKGFLATSIALLCGYNLYIAHLCGSVAVLGHCFPLFHQFKGGKGAATYFGTIFALSYNIGSVGFLIWFLSVVGTRNAGIASIITSLMTPIVTMLCTDLYSLLLPITIMCILIILMHHKNIKNLPYLNVHPEKIK